MWSVNIVVRLFCFRDVMPSDRSGGVDELVTRCVAVASSSFCPTQSGQGGEIRDMLHRMSIIEQSRTKLHRKTNQTHFNIIFFIINKGKNTILMDLSFYFHVSFLKIVT